jgi:hypothetical protein
MRLSNLVQTIQTKGCAAGALAWQGLDGVDSSYARFGVAFSLSPVRPCQAGTPAPQCYCREFFLLIF